MNVVLEKPGLSVMEVWTDGTGMARATYTDLVFPEVSWDDPQFFVTAEEAEKHAGNFVESMKQYGFVEVPDDE